jgi:hypothetical protein
MITQAEPNHKTSNPLARFVTKEAVAKVLNVAPEKIREIRLWPYVIHVVGEGISRFLTLPPLKGMGFLRNFVLNIPITRVGGRNPFA